MWAISFAHSSKWVVSSGIFANFISKDYIQNRKQEAQFWQHLKNMVFYGNQKHYNYLVAKNLRMEMRSISNLQKQTLQLILKSYFTLWMKVNNVKSVKVVSSLAVFRKPVRRLINNCQPKQQQSSMINDNLLVNRETTTSSSWWAMWPPSFFRCFIL